MKRRHEIVRRALEIKRRRKTRRAVLILGGVVLILLAVFFLLRSERWIIDQVVVSGPDAPTEASGVGVGSQSAAPAAIESAVRQGLAGRYLWFFPKGSIFWYPKDKIIADLLERFPNLARVELRLININTLAILVEGRRGKFVWCSEACYFADDSGLIFASAPPSSNDVFLEFSGPLPPDPIGRRPLPEAEFRKITGFEKEFSDWLDSFFAVFPERPPAVRGVIIGEDGDFEFILRRLAPSGVEGQRVLRLLFNIKQNLSGAIANLRSALAAEELQKIFRADPLVLEYIDLRFPPKVFYKIRQ